MYKCHNHLCVPSDVVCDFVDNCGDNSDELECSELFIHLFVNIDHWRHPRKNGLTPNTKAIVVRNAIIQSPQRVLELTHSSSEAAYYQYYLLELSKNKILIVI